jgi:hypothetical protein
MLDNGIRRRWLPFFGLVGLREGILRIALKLILSERSRRIILGQSWSGNGS